MRRFALIKTGAVSLLLVLPLLAFAAWQEPSAAPPGSNAAAALNVGLTDQVKQGGLAVNGLLWALNNFLVSGSIWADAYCDVAGENCHNASEIGQSANSGGNALKTYIGATPAAYTGSGVGGYAEGDTKCKTAFTDSRMCLSADFVNARPSAAGWYTTFAAASFIGGNKINDCNGWTSAGMTLYGNFWTGANGYPDISSCSIARQILCCK